MMIGRYAVKRELGRGGMGVVYLAHDAELERDVAIKTLPGVDESNPDRLRRFEREAKVLAAINHPNIATIYSIEKTDDGLRFIVLEYIEGETLGRILKKNAANLRQSMELCVQVAKAIAAAHAKGVVHRDIKPGNVMITPDMTAKVLDFGLSMRESTNAADIDVTRTVQTMPGQVMGTPGYMSPEQARGKPVDKRADIWSFGCILFHALAGQPAFHGETSTDVIAATLHHDPDWTLLPLSTPRNVRDLLQRMLVKKADERLDEITPAIEVLGESIHRFSTTGHESAAQYGDYEAVKELHAGPHAAIWEVRPAGLDKVSTPGLPSGGENLSSEEPNTEERISRRYIAKIVEPPSVNLGPDQAVRMLDTFRAATALQNKLAGAPETRHWAPIHDHGQFPGGAFYVTDYVQHTAADLFASDVGMNADELYSVVHGVVCALCEIDRMLQRPHGKLKPANILLKKEQADNDGKTNQWAVLLTDPASDAELESSGKKFDDDLHELGKLLYRLALGEEWRGRTGAAVPLTSAWKQLGRRGTQWHALCNELLSETPPSLTEVAARLEQLQPRTRSVIPPTPLTVAAGVVVLAVGVWVAMTILGTTDDGEPPLAPEREEVAVEPSPTPEISEPDEPSAAESEPASTPEPDDEREQKRALLLAMWTNWGREMLAIPTSELSAIASDLGAGTSFDDAVNRVQWLDEPSEDEDEAYYDDAIRGLSGLRDELKQLLEQLDELRFDYVRLRGWDQAGSDLRSRIQRVERILEATEPIDEPDSSIVSELTFLRDVVTESDAVVERNAALEEELGHIRQWMEENHEMDDPVLRQLTASIERELSTADLRDLHTELIDWYNATRQVREALDHWARLDTNHLREHNEAYRRIDRPGGLRRADFARWAEDVAGDRHIQLTEQDDPRLDPAWREQVEQWSEQLQQVQNRWAEVCHDRPQPEAYEFQESYERLLAIEWDNSHRMRDEIRQKQRELESLFEREHMAWRSELLECAGECEEQLQLALRPLPHIPDTASRFIDPLIRDAWQRVHDEAEGGDCPELRDTATQIRRFVEGATDRLNVPSWEPSEDDLPVGIQQDAIITIMQEKWQTLTADAFDMVDDVDWQRGIAPDDPFWKTLRRQQDAFAEWQRDAKNFLPDLRDMHQWLERAYGWSDIAQTYDQWRDTDVQRDFSQLVGISEVIEQVERLKAFAQRPRITSRADAQQLVAAIEDEQHSPAYRFSAWRKLGQAADQQLPDYLDMEAQISTHMESLFDSLEAIDRVRAGELRNQWRDGRQSRWLAYVDAAGDRQAMRNAFERMDEFHIVGEVIEDAEQFTPRLRFNFELHRFLMMAAAHDHESEQEPQSREAIQRQADAVLDWMQRVEMSDAAWGEWRTALHEVAGFDIETDEDRGPDWSDIGPARFGWVHELEEDGEIVRYRPPSRWMSEEGPMLRRLLGDDPVITFRRVPVGEGDDAPVTYLSTTEVSVGLFIAVARQAGMEPILRRQFLRTVRSRGAKLWDWHGDTMELEADIWLRLQRMVEDDLPAPSPQFPMQRVTPVAASAVASRLGSRLPTEAEWRAAMQDAVDRRETIQANLRGPGIDELVARAAEHNRARPLDRVDLPDAGSSVDVLSREWSTENEEADELAAHIEPNARGWFVAVESHSAQFEHLLGNVAELVLAHALTEVDLEAALPDPLEQPEAFVERWRELAVGEDGRAAIRVIGGSIFATPGEHALARSAPYAVSRRLESHVNQQAYSDVGFRVAFAGTAQISPERQFQHLVDRALDETGPEPFLFAQRQ